MGQHARMTSYRKGGRLLRATRDIVGIGAINLDYIVGADRGHPAGARLERALAEHAVPRERGTERSVGEPAIAAVLRATEAARPATVLGGSALNAVTAIAHTRAG